MALEAYSRVSGRFWIDTKAWGERNQIVALYLLTNRHRTMEGLYYLPLGYLCEDLGLTPKQARDAIEFIEAQGMVSYDHHAQVVFLRKALKHGAPKTAMHIKGAVSRLREVRASCHWPEFLMACECHSSGLADAIRVEWSMAFESSSSSSINPTLTLPKEGNNNGHHPSEEAPLKPPGNRKRDQVAFDAQMTAWANHYFPDADPGAVSAAVGWLASRDTLTSPVTVRHVRDLAATNPIWGTQLQPHQHAAAPLNIQHTTTKGTT